MSDAGYVFCMVVAAREHADTCPAGEAGQGPHPKRPIWETSHTPRLPGPEEYAETLSALRRHLA